MITIIVAKFPFLAWGPIEVLVGVIVGKIVDLLVNETELRLFYVYTDFRIASQAQEYIKKVKAYEENPSPENIEKAKKKFEKFVILAR